MSSNMDLVPEEVLEELKALDRQLGTTKRNLEALLEPVQGISKELAKSAVSYKQLTDLVNKLSDAEKKANDTFNEQDKALGEVQKLQKKLISLHSDEAKEVAKLKEEIREKNKENRESARAMLEEAEAAERLCDRLNDIPEEKTVKVIVQTERVGEKKGVPTEDETPGFGEGVKEAVRSLAELEAAFNEVSAAGFTDVSGLIERNAEGMVDYSSAVSSVGSRLAYVESLENDYKAALDAGALSTEEYAKKVEALEGVERELESGLEQLLVKYKEAKAEAENVCYSSEAAAEAFGSLSERAQQLTLDLIEMRTAQEEVKGNLKDLEAAYLSGAVSEEDYIQQKAELSTVYDDNSRAIKRVTQELALEVKAASTAAGSYDNLSARYSLLKLKLNAMTDAGRENTEEFRNMQEEARQLYEEMKNVESATGKEQLNVGNYPDLPEWLENTIGELSKVPGAASAAAGGFSSISMAMKALMANPIVALIAAIVTVLSTLFDAFKRSETGSRLLEKAGNALNAVMMVLTGVMEKVAQGIKSLFEDPKEALKSFGEMMKNLIIARFQAAVSYVIALKDAAVALFHLDFDKVGESLKKAGESFLTMATGLTTTDVKNVVSGFNEMTDSVGKYNAALNKLTDDQKAVKKRNEELTRQIADLSVEEAKYSTIAQDTSLSAKERLDAEEKAHAAAEKRAKAEYTMAKSNFDLIKQELELRKRAGENVEELETKYTQAYTAMRQAEQQCVAESEKSQQRRNAIVLQNAVKEIDILTETTASQIAVNLKKVKNDENTYEQRKGIIESSRNMLEASLAAEIAAIERYAEGKIDIEALMAEESQTAVNEQIEAMGLPVQMQEKLLKVIKNYRQEKQALDDADVASEKKRVDEVMKELSREASARGRELTKGESKENLDLSKEYAQGLMSEEVYQAKKKAIADKYTQQRFEAEKSMLEKSLNVSGLTEEEQLKIREQIANKEVELEKWKNDQEIASAEAAAKKKEELEQALKEKKEELLQAVFDFANQLGEQQFEAKLKKLDEESEENEEWAEEEKERIDRLEESGAISKEEADARKALVDQQAAEREEQLAEKKKEIQKRQAIYEKAMNVAKIGWSTAAAIINIWRDVPKMDFGISATALSAVVAGLGAAQIASVLATPIPEYAHGTKDHPGGLAIVGDGGRPEMVLASGMIYKTPSTDTLVDLPKHATVLPDFAMALNGLPVLPSLKEREDRVISFEELSGLMKESNSKLGKIAVTLKKDKKNRGYNSGLFNVNKIGV